MVLVSLCVYCLTKYLCLVFSNPMFSPLPYLKGLNKYALSSSCLLGILFYTVYS